ncbi:resuscitation-promoting factor [Desertihabitans aurantiacus]|uniref:resuscitation-promoting factor n=1 Tax=Desertihabitans aurantiacus TaxID=2282477 RepID=UPI000DF8368D|nr:resuscitation-promoting factor [Desertihabitans aurantiacus]
MRKLVPVSIAAAAALAVTGGIVGYQVADKTVEVSVDGVPTTVTSFGSDVGDVLEQQGITVGERDLVAPSATTEIEDGSRIAVRYGREVTIEVDGQTATHWTTATTVGEALAVLQIKAEGADISTSRSAAIGREGLEFSVDTLKRLELDVAGKTSSHETTASTVGDVLAEAEVAYDEDDKVTPTPAEAAVDGTRITVVAVEVKDETAKQPVDFKTVRKETSELLQGTTETETEGVAGERTIVTTVTKENGKVVKEEKKSDEVTREPVDEVVLVGTREPEPEPKRSTGGSSSGGSSSGGSSSGGSSGGSSSDDDDDDSSSGSSGGSSSGSSDGVWDRLAKCESGGNWSINTGNGYYGGVQFSAQTWKAYGGKGLPHENSKAEQIRIAKKLQAAAGWGQWPHCSAKLGLR